MSFEDIPEDIRQSYPCPNCQEGNITEYQIGVWECDTCGWEKGPKND